MKFEDLQVGDWVLIHEPECKGHRIDYICEMDEEVGADGELYSIDDIRPIPLTQEILGRNGFDVSDKEVMQYHFEEDGEKYHFSLRQMYDKDGKPHGFSFNAFNVLTLIDYVHQLQHALRLCGIEHDIDKQEIEL